jgi:hypothetical protein
MQLERRPNYDCYVDYFWPKSAWLEENCLIGDLDYLGSEADKTIDDPLMQNIPAYNCVSRTYEGFNNVNEDLNHGMNQRMYRKRPKEVQERIKKYKTHTWTNKEYIWSYYVHRSTGSGFYASKPWHGYHNSSVTYFGTFEKVEEMANMMIEFKAADKKMFSTIGNQNPTPIKGLNLVQHITTFGVDLIEQLTEMLELNHAEGNPALKQKDVTDWCNQKNLDRGMRRWNFPYAQMAADIATYHPHLIDPNSSLYCGNNASIAIDQMFRKPAKMALHEYHDLALQDLTERLGTSAVAHEDTLCIFVRFLNNLDRSGNNFRNKSGYYMIDRFDKPLYEDIWTPKPIITKSDASLEEFFV